MRQAILQSMKGPKAQNCCHNDKKRSKKKLEHPKNFARLTSFDDYQLDETLVSVKYNYYVQNRIFGCKILHPIFITEETAQSKMIDFFLIGIHSMQG